MENNPYAPPKAETAPPEAAFSAQTGEPLNPWRDIWNRPRATIQQIVDTDPARHVIALAAAAGIGEMLDNASSRSSGDTVAIPVIIGVALVAGPFVGVIGLYLGSALFWWTGRWLDGKAPLSHVRAALAWPGVVAVIASLLYIPMLILAGPDLFTTQTPRLDANMTLAIIFWSLQFVYVVLAVWGAVVLLKCLGQVQGFSAWKALGNVALGILVVAVPVGLVIALVATMMT